MVWLRCCRAYKAVLPKSPQNSPFTYLWTLTTSQVTLISTTCKTQLILWSIVYDSCQVPVLVPAMSSTFSVVPTVSPVMFTKPILWPGPSWNPMAPCSMAERGAGLILLPAAAGQHSLGWGGKKRSYKSRKTLLLHKRNVMLPSLAKADKNSLHSRSNSGLQHMAKQTHRASPFLLSQIHAIVHTGGLFFLLCSYMPLKQKVWAYKYCVIESYSVYCMLSVALPFLPATYLSALAAVIPH